MMGSINYITTIINMRAPGMHLFRMPLVIWSLFITAILLLLALPVLTSGVAMLLFDRTLGTSWFHPSGGGEPLLWQHLFWYFGHPEVYILILPAMGIASEILPVFSRKPIFGYHAMAFSMIGIAFLSWVVYGHHMFVSGMNPSLGMAFMVSTMIIAVPSAIKTFNWLGTLWGGRIQFKVPMLFALGFVSMFVIGGLSGIFMASTPVDIYIQDTYFIVGPHPLRRLRRLHLRRLRGDLLLVPQDVRADDESPRSGTCTSGARSSSSTGCSSPCTSSGSAARCGASTTPCSTSSCSTSSTGTSS